MSYINKTGKTAAARKMIVRRQASDVVAYHQIQTTLTKAKETQRRVDKLITWAKKDTVASRRLAARWLTDNQKGTAGELLQHLFAKIGPAFKERPGGYTRVLKLGKRPGDATEMAVLQLVQRVAPYSAPKKAAKPKTDKPAGKPAAKQPAGASSSAKKHSAAEHHAGTRTVELLNDAQPAQPALQGPTKQQKEARERTVEILNATEPAAPALGEAKPKK